MGTSKNIVIGENIHSCYFCNNDTTSPNAEQTRSFVGNKVLRYSDYIFIALF